MVWYSENQPRFRSANGADRTTFLSAQAIALRVKVRAHVIFEGLVQGVFFRANAKRCADSLRLTGWVRNRPDGTVEAVFEGEEERVKEAIEWCASRQPYAQVEQKREDISAPSGEFESFTVR